MSFRSFVIQALTLWLIIAVLVLIFGLIQWAFAGGDLANVLRSAILWPAHFTGGVR